MSTLNGIYGLHDILFKMGLMETLCFTVTMGGDWWFIENDTLFYSHWNSTGKCNGIIEHWDIV